MIMLTQYTILLYPIWLVNKNLSKKTLITPFFLLPVRLKNENSRSPLPAS